MAQPLSRRDRVRAATVTEIKDTARRILVAEGVDGLSLRAIARDMGMTAPALYRYFPSREELLVDLIADLYDELSGELEATRDELADDDLGGRLTAVSRTFRRWSIGHPAEFALLFGSPLPGPADPAHAGHEQSRAHEAGTRFGQVFGELVARVYLTRPFPVPAEEDIDPALQEQLRAWCDTFPVALPLGVMQVFLSCWIRLYGSVTMEVFGHLRFAVADAEPVFEAELAEAARLLGFPGLPAGPTAAGR
ncbi:MAG: TetR/AcrR family transcriptional regulator [Mycobacteriales bacterium]